MTWKMQKDRPTRSLSTPLPSSSTWNRQFWRAVSPGKALELEESVTTHCLDKTNSDAKFSATKKEIKWKWETPEKFYGVPRQMLVANGATIRYYPPQPVFPPSTAVSQPKWVCRKTWKTGYLKIAIHIGNWIWCPNIKKSEWFLPPKFLNKWGIRYTPKWLFEWGTLW